MYFKVEFKIQWQTNEYIWYKIDISSLSLEVIWGCAMSVNHYDVGYKIFLNITSKYHFLAELIFLIFL